MNLLRSGAFFVPILLFFFICYFYNFEKYGDIFQFFLPFCVGVFFIYKKEFKKLKILIIAMLVSTFLAHFAKWGIFYYAQYFHCTDFLNFARRPASGSFNGFPSGHTQGAFVGATFALIFFQKYFKILFLILASLVGYSRIFYEHHTPFQVSMGALLAASVCVSIIYIYLFKNKKQRFKWDCCFFRLIIQIKKNPQ